MTVRPRRIALALPGLALLLLGNTGPVAAAAPATQSYTITDLGLAPEYGVANTVVVNAINIHEQIVGTMTGSGGTFGAHYGFRWQAGAGLQVLPGQRSGVSSMAARGINDSGQIAGTGLGDPFTHGPSLYALLWQPDGSVQQLGASPDPRDTGTAINNMGQVVGNQGTHGFLWDARHGLRDIGAFVPAAINNKGTVAGSTSQGHVVLWDNRHGLRDLGTLPGSVQSFAASINDVGQVVGRTYANGGAPGHAFIWDNKLGMRAIDFLPGSTSNQATGINASGRVVGTASGRAFTWQAGGSVQELPNLPGIDAAHGMKNIQISAGAINGKGEIAGVVSWTTGTNSSTIDNHVVLWKP